MKKPIVIAVCGKGGVGKTCISALLVNMLSDNPEAKVLAIDADPAAGLSIPLGISVKKTVDDIRKELINNLKDGITHSRSEIIKSLDFEIFNAIEEKENIAFLSIGRPEGDGCFCKVNSLLKDIIKDLSQNFDYVVIDAEAGIEQVERRVLEMVTHLILVSDASLKGRHVTETIKNVAKEKFDIKKTGIILNRMASEAEIIDIAAVTDIDLIHGLTEIPHIRSFDREGKAFFDLPQINDVNRLYSAIDRFFK